MNFDLSCLSCLSTGALRAASLGKDPPHAAPGGQGWTGDAQSQDREKEGWHQGCRLGSPQPRTSALPTGALENRSRRLDLKGVFFANLETSKNANSQAPCLQCWFGLGVSFKKLPQCFLDSAKFSKLVLEYTVMSTGGWTLSSR